jgi:AraC-like DNA-binding protein
LKQFIELRNTGATGIIGIRFLPFGMSAFTKIPIDQFTDLEVPLEFVFGKSAHHLVEEIMLAPDNDFRVRLLQKYLICNLQPRPRELAMVEHVVNMINSSGGNCSITRLAGAACISERQLVRVFSASVGLTPKHFSKIVRLQRCLAQLGQIQTGPIVDVAFDNGYFDHAHLVRDFRQFTGMTPSDYLKENRDFTDLFIAT